MRTATPRWARRSLIALVVVGGLVLGACGRMASRQAEPVASTSAVAPTSERYDPYAGTLAAGVPQGNATPAQLRTADGRTRDYRVYVPTSVRNGARVPLLIALHGGMGSSAQFETNSGFDGLAESNGFIVAYPDGIAALPNGSGPQTWNGGYCCGRAARINVDDVAFVRALITTLEGQFAIDPARVYATGHSNGAILAYRLACELSDRIVAVGLQAGSLGVESCNGARPVSLFHLHGSADTNHPIDGGSGSGVAGVNFRSARGSVEAIVAHDGCPTTATPGVDPANPDVTALSWSTCRDNTAVRYVVVAGASHAWMGHPATSRAAAQYVGEPYANFDASRAIWSFLASHPRR